MTFSPDVAAAIARTDELVARAHEVTDQLRSTNQRLRVVIDEMERADRGRGGNGLRRS